MIGTQINNYKITRKIGLGGPISLYLAEDSNDANNKVVAKIMDKTLANNPKIVEQFKKIMPEIVKLSHKNIINTIAYHAANDYLSTFSEALSGQNLQFVILIKGLSKTAKLEIFTHIINAVEYAHSQNIIHKNLKPSNIFIPAKYNKLKVLDFCTSTVLGLNNTETIINTVFESPMFMSPEIVSGSTVDLRTDIYSLGVLLYFMISHKTPYLKTAPNQVLVDNIKNDPIPELKGYSQINEIIKKATEKDKENRHQSCAELLKDVENIM